MAEINGEERALIMNAVLRIALRYPNILQREAFTELVEVVSRATPVGHIVLGVPDGPGHIRVYAISPGPAEAFMPFGARLPSMPWLDKSVFQDGTPFYCNDTRVGGERAQMAAQVGHLSYVVFPARSGGEVRAGLIVSFHELTGAANAPASLLQEIADIIGENLERALRTTRERRLALILETSGDAMLAWDRTGLITDANAAAMELTGRKREELIGTPLTELLGPQTDQGSATPPPAWGTRMEIVRPPTRSGEARRVAVAATFTPVENDPLVAANVLLRDLSDVVMAERQAAIRRARIKELEEQHRSLLDNAPLIIFRLDPHTNRLSYLNRHAERLLGVPTDEAMATPGFLRSAHADPEGALAFDGAVARAASGAESLPYEARLKRRGGDEIMARGTVFPLFEKGHVVAIEGVLADVSAERAARTRLVQSDRLTTLGMLAAGVAHEINNPAAYLLLGLDMLDKLLVGPGVAMDASSREQASARITELRDSIKRIVDIARDLRLFAGSPGAAAGRRSMVDVNRTIESALTLTRGQIIERAEIVRDLQDVPPVMMRDGRLGQVLVNLLVNASQAIPKEFPSDHSITVRTRSDDVTVEIEVTDTGVGISQENLPRIWTPFFTTKRPDVGTGLGLSISKEIVERTGGSIRAESPVPGTDPPRGARFVITIPVAGAVDARPVSSGPARASAPSARARVLLVDDEAALARALATEIGESHDVTLADCASAALEQLASRRFDAILCDLRMPGMTGDALYEKVAAADPEQAGRFIFMTGVGFGAGIESFLKSSGRPVLEKPFSTDVALAEIERVCTAARA